MAGVERVYSISGSVNAVPGTTGPAGKSAYAYAVDGGYKGTEQEFAAKLAAELPEALPNPQALTFTGAATGTYDGGEAVEIEIPSGVSSTAVSELLCEAVLPAESAVGTSIPLGITMADLDAYKELYIIFYGASYTACANVYVKLSGTHHNILRTSEASVCLVVVRECDNPDIVTGYIGTGNPSVINKTPIKINQYFGIDQQAGLLDRAASRMDWSSYSKTAELEIYNSYAVPTIDYTLQIYGTRK